MLFRQNSIEVDPVERHDVPRHDLKRVRSFQLLNYFIFKFLQL